MSSLDSKLNTEIEIEVDKSPDFVDNNKAPEVIIRRTQSKMNLQGNVETAL